MRLRLDVAIQLAEEDVVGTQFADFKRLVPVGRAAGTDDHLRHEFLDRFPELGKRARHMQPIRPDAAGNPAVTGNQCGGTRRLDDRHQQLGVFLERLVVEPVLRHDDGGDVAARQSLLEQRGLAGALAIRFRQYQHKAAAIFRFGHIFFRLAARASGIRTRFLFTNSIDRSDCRINRHSRLKSLMPDTFTLTFYAAAIPAVFLVGLSKGGIGGALALMGVPLMSMAVDPVKAAAIFLPILILMDIVALWSWRNFNDRKTLLMILPGGVIGIALGWATSAYVSDDALRLVIATATILFTVRYFWQVYGPHGRQPAQPLPHRPVAATFWGSLSGYASFVAHAGGPPFQIYVLPMKLDPKSYTGASVRFFAIVNAVKVIPYFYLGALDRENMVLSVTLLPVALVATALGAAIVRHLKAEAFYPMAYGLAFCAGLKLLWDGSPF